MESYDAIRAKLRDCQAALDDLRRMPKRNAVDYEKIKVLQSYKCKLIDALERARINETKGGKK